MRAHHVESGRRRPACGQGTRPARAAHRGGGPIGPGPAGPHRSRRTARRRLAGRAWMPAAASPRTLRLERAHRPAARGRAGVRRLLLDINVLLALLDSDHVDHVRAHEWLDEEIAYGWASCPITQNGFVRVISQPRYPSPISPAQAIELLDRACASSHHAQWPCDL